MSIVGIITEYNPFHYGHLYHLHKAKEITHSETLITIMNGNFVQRGEPALLDKWSRARMALANGADLVIELPLVYGIRSAEYFARGAITILEKSKIIDSIVFGSEVGKITPLEEMACLLSDEDKYLQEILQKELANGKSFPAARELAIKNYLLLNPEKFSFKSEELLNIIAEPNNILAIEYLKNLKNINSNITPFTIRRVGSNYHDKKLEGNFVSATAIRKLVYKDQLENLKKYLPEKSYEILKTELEKENIPINFDCFSLMLISTLRKLNIKKLSEFAEINNGLERRIYDEAYKTSDLKELVRNIKTKAYTWTRIQRNLLHIFFNITEKDFNHIDHYGPQYIRVLGLKKERTDLLARLNEKATLPVIISPADYLNEINPASQDPLIKSLSYDIMATDIYNLLYKNPAYRQGHLDFLTPLIKY